MPPPEPEAATARLAELDAAYRGPAPSSSPSTPAEAAARLRVLANDRDWGRRYLDGSIAERHEFAALTQLAASGDQMPETGGITTVIALDDPLAQPPRRPCRNVGCTASAGITRERPSVHGTG
jgi:hypothetical protein